MLNFETILPVDTVRHEDRIFYDFGSNYVGYLCANVRGKKGDVVTVRCAQELNDDGSHRYNLRANCKYEETWVLSDGENTLDWFDYKSFRYIELLLPSEVEVENVSFLVRYYPFSLKV